MVDLRRHMREHIANSDLMDQTEKVLRFPKGSEGATEDDGEEALKLVYRAAEVIRAIESRAAAVEARTRTLAEDAIEKLQHAENHIRLLETEQREAEERIREVENALQLSELRIASVENQLSQAELRTRTAEKRASEAERSLKRIEDAIRTHLLGQRGVSGGMAEAA